MNSISIRDDDINYFTDAERLKQIYEPMFAYVKPTLCITPFAGQVYWEVRLRENELLGTPAKVAFVRDFHEKHPQEAGKTSAIWDNAPLVRLLREWIAAGRVDIALHGITHNPTVSGYECDSTRPDIKVLEQVLADCKAAFGVDVVVFSPPNNSINAEWFKAVSGLGMHIVHSAGPKPWEVPPSVSALGSCTRIIADRLQNGRMSRVHRVLNFGRVRLVPSIPTLPFSKLDSIHSVIDRMADSGEDHVLVIATHSYAFDYDPDMYDRVMALARHAHERQFVPLGLADVLGRPV
jgi:hypothetical protein